MAFTSCIPGCPAYHYVDQVGHKLKYPFASTLNMRILKATTP